MKETGQGHVSVDGLFNIDKPRGLTSHDVVDVVRRLIGHRRVGHTGTLDPLATGVLVVAVGQATRLIEFMTGHDKEYRFTLRLGEETDTLDAEGEIVERAPVPPLDEETIRAVLRRFTGTIEQVPPAHAAIRHRGRRLYEWARMGRPVTPPPRRVHIYALDLEAWQPPELTLRVTCSAGTYVRALARDIARALNTRGHVTALRRLASGPFRVEDAVPLRVLESASDWRAYLLPVDAGLRHIPPVHLTPEQWAQVQHGRSPRGLPPGEEEGEWRRAYYNGRLVAMLRWDAARKRWHPKKVLHPGDS